MILAALIVTSIAALTGLAEAQSTLEAVKKRGKLIAGVKTDFPPFGTVDASGKNVGFDVDVAHRFARALFNDESQVEPVAVTSGNRIPFLQYERTLPISRTNNPTAISRSCRPCLNR